MNHPDNSCGQLRLAAAVLAASTFAAVADCTFTNTPLLPLPEFGFVCYSNVYHGGLYLNGSNQRPAAHESNGVAIAQALKPLDSAGNVDTNSGKIALLSLGMSNTTQEWATKGTGNFKLQALADPSLNPRVTIVDGAIGGQDAPDWTNFNAQTWDMVITQRLVAAGVTTNQVQVLWLKQALAGPLANYGSFPLHARALQSQMEIILRNAKIKYPNLKLAYLSCRTRSYESTPSALNPEPFAYETGFADKWVVEDQILVRSNLNYNASSGPVVAPWLSWGPYIWADGLDPRSDGFTWLCGDLEGDYTHPSATGGVPKVARQLLAFFKTDPTTTPWFLKPSGAGAPACAPSASVTNGTFPLTVNFSANAVAGSAPLRDYQWTFDNGEFSTNANPTVLLRSPGLYRSRLTVTDTNGNTAQGSVAIKVTGSLAQWRTARFTQLELADPLISGASADPDWDRLPNALEFMMGLDPKSSNRADTVSAALTNGVFTLTHPHFKFAEGLTLALEVSNDLSNWTAAPATSLQDLGNVETLVVAEVAINAARFFRLKAAP